MIKAGFAEVDITPSPGMSVTSFSESAAHSALTPLSITASVFSDGQKTVAVAGIDAPVIEGEVFAAAFAELKKKTGLDLLLCCASHTHKGGPVIRRWAGNDEIFRKIEEIPKEIRDLGLETSCRICSPVKCGDRKLNEKYYVSFKDKIAKAVTEAAGCMEEVRLINGRSTVYDVGYNRRQKMKNGFTVSHAGKGNPDIVDFAGPCDNELVALAAVNKDNKIIGTIVNYACHGTVENSNHFSADWPYFMRETVRKMTGPENITVFANGCCGDVTQINNLSTEPLRSGGKWPEILGQRVGFAAVDAISNGDPETFNKISFMTENLKLGYRKPGRKNYENAVRQMNITPDTEYSRFWATGVLLLKRKSELYPDIDCGLNVLQIGNLIICTTPAETFAATGLAVKSSSKFPYTMVVELTNGWLGYMPTKDVFGPHGGGYEGQFKFGSYMEKTAEEKVRTKLREMINKFSPEKEIKRQKVEPGKPWWPARPDEL
ncbi:MAG TPA: hypothetical protein PKN36_05790 [bacterium]|nr:hypothetical protein [bacterium]